MINKKIIEKKVFILESTHILSMYNYLFQKIKKCKILFVNRQQVEQLKSPYSFSHRFPFFRLNILNLVFRICWQRGCSSLTYIIIEHEGCVLNSTEIIIGIRLFKIVGDVGSI